MNHEITVTQKSDEDGRFVFGVAVDDYEYTVAVTQEYWQQLTGGHIAPDELVRRSFAFLLERESPGAILPEFDLPLITRYFPDYEQTVRKNITAE